VPARPVDKFILRHAYLQIADDIARRIDDGEFTYKLPSERAFTEEYETSYATARRAMEELRDRGVITTIHGRGTYVTAALPKGETTDEA
jgi:GntR family transcriptional regulator